MTRQQTNRNKTDRSKNRSETPTTKYLFGGKLDENDWKDIVDDEESEQIVYEYVTDVVNHAIEAAYKNYLSRQLIPFTVYQVSEALLQMIELEFIYNDPVDNTTSAAWLEDDVPPPCKIDSWAQGAMSKSCDLSILDKTKEKESIEDGSTPMDIIAASDSTTNETKTADGLAQKPQKPQTVPKVSKNPKKLTIPQNSKTTATQGTPKNKKLDLKSQAKAKQLSSAEQTKQRKSTLEPHQTQLKDSLMIRQNEALDIVERSDEGLKRVPEVTTKKLVASKKRFTGSERFAFDDEGNLVGVPRLVSTPTKVNRANKQAVLQEQPADRLGSITNTVSVKWRVMPGNGNKNQSPLGDMMERSSTPDFHLKRSPMLTAPDIQLLKRKQQVKAMATGLFSVIDLMEPMPGVSVSDGERTRVGIGADKQRTGDLEERKWDQLKQVQHVNDVTRSAATVSKLLAEQMLKLDAIQIGNTNQ